MCLPKAVKAKANSRPDDLVRVLTRFVRVLTVEQAQRFGLATDGALRQTIEQHRRRGILATLRVPVIAIEPAGQPLLKWVPGDPGPEWDELSRRLRRRWGGDAVMRTLVHATRLGGSLHGSRPGRPPRSSEASHDVALAEIFLRHFHRQPAGWRREDELPAEPFAHAPVRPDACVFRKGRVVAIELGGRYRPEKLKRFHDFCDDREVPYELW